MVIGSIDVQDPLVAEHLAMSSGETDPQLREYAMPEDHELQKQMLDRVNFIELVGRLTRERDITVAKVQIQNQPQINAQYGRKTGDLVIAEIRELLLGLQANSAVGQVSPTLYGVAVLNSADPQELLTEIKEALDNLNQRKLFPFIIELAVGISVTDHLVKRNAQDWLDQANLALVASNRLGRGQIYDPENIVSEHIREIFARLTSASTRPDGMYWVFQPIVQTHSGEIFGYEALARWNMPEFGDVPPSTFIQIAEELGVVRFIDRWALESVEIHHSKLFSIGGQCVSVNMSPQTIVEDNSLVARVAEMVARNENCECQLIIELTESSVAHTYEDISPSNLRDQLVQLRQSGVLIAIDDFGTGETSLATIGSLPCDFLKLDRSLLHLGSEKLAKGMIDIGKQIAALLHAKVVLEGIETAEELEYARELDIDYVQGWQVGYPISVD